MGNRPNILLLLPDQHRGDWLGLYGLLPVRTPNIDRLALRGTVFTQALCPSPLCAPSRAAFATGLAYDRCPVKHNGQDLPSGTRTFYADLRDAGYRVATCGKLDLLKMSGSWGADGRHADATGSKLDALGFDAGSDNGGKHDAVMAYRDGRPEPYTLYLASRGLADVHADDYARRGRARAGSVSGHAVHYLDTEPTALPDDAYCDNWIGRNAIEILRGFPVGNPWFLQINFCGPHEPMDVTKSMKDRWRNVDFPVPDETSGLTAVHHREIRRNYASMIENVDAWVGAILGHLAETGRIENTVVIYASDHGEMLGDRGLWEKHVPWHPSVHVPLVLAGPGYDAGMRDGRAVSLTDLTATIRHIAGVPAPDGVDGMPLVPGAPERRAAISGLGTWRMASDGRHVFISGYDPKLPRKAMTQGTYDPSLTEPLLYDLAADPHELQNVAAAHPDLTARFAARIAESTRR